jgi:hypothetical protein
MTDGKKHRETDRKGNIGEEPEAEDAERGIPKVEKHCDGGKIRWKRQCIFIEEIGDGRTEGERGW